MATPTIRGTSSLYVNNVASVLFALPTGSAAGDTCFIFAGHGYNVVTPTGWTQLSNLAGSNANGAVFSRVLDNTDAAAGTVTITFGGGYYGFIAAITTSIATGAIDPVAAVYQRDSAGAGSVSVTTVSLANGPPVAGDYAVYFAYSRGNGAVTSAGGAALRSNTALEGSGVLTGGALGAGGNFSNTFTFGGAPTGDYISVLVLRAAGASSPAVREAQVVRQTISSGAGRVKNPQVVRQTISSGAGVVKSPQVIRQTISSGSGRVKNTQVVRLVLRSTAVAVSRRRKPFVTG